MSERRQTHNGYDTKFRVQGAMKVDLPDPAALARRGNALLQEADELLQSMRRWDGDNTEQANEVVELHTKEITALSALATAHFTAASYYWEDR